MSSTPGVLSLLALVLAGPTALVLARMPSLRRTPRAAMVLWQAVAMAAVLSALGAGLSLAAPDDVGVQARPVAVVALAVTGLVLGRLLLSGHRVGTRLRRLRRRHRELVDLLSRDDRGVRVVEHETPLAYCVPGARHARVVLSEGALDLLTEKELRAVLAHERAHLRARHDLVLEAFSVLHHAFPRFAGSGSALREVRLLAEVLADRAAARTAGAPSVARALVAVAGGRTPDASLGAQAGVDELVIRVRLLGNRSPRPVQAAVVATAALAVVVVPTLVVVQPWISSLL